MPSATQFKGSLATETESPVCSRNDKSRSPNKAPPEKGKANKDVVSLVAETFGLTPSDVEILSGETSPDKVVRLPLASDEAARRLRAYLTIGR